MIVSTPEPEHSDGLVAFRTGRTRWDAAPADIPTLFDPNGLRLEAWLRSGVADIVKHGPHRTVYRLRLPEGTYYLKHYRLADWRARLQNVVRPCRAMLEWTAARAVTAAGIDTFETVALGRTLEGGLVTDSYLATRSIDGTETLHDFCEERLEHLPAAHRSRLRMEIARQLGRLVARLHASGLLHHDLHAGNVLIRCDDRQRVTLWLIDLHAVEARSRVTYRQARRNMALLSHFFVRHATSADRLRFFRAYWWHLNAAGSARVAGRSFAAAVRDVQQYCTRATLRAYRRGDRKWQRANRRLIIADAGSVRCRGVADIGRDRLESFRRDPEQLFAVPGLRRPRAVPALTRTARVSVWIDGTRLSALVIARETTSWRERLRRMLGKSPLRVAWENGHALLRRGIDAPRPLVWISQSDRGILREYLLLEASEGGVPLLELPEDETECPRATLRERWSTLVHEGGPALAARR